MTKYLPNPIDCVGTTKWPWRLLIDVREPAEFLLGHIKGSINLPASEFSVAQYEPYADRHFTLICNTGKRAKYTAELLHKLGHASVDISHGQMKVIGDQNRVTSQASNIVEVQFFTVISALLLISVVGTVFVSNLFLLIPTGVSLGLVIAVFTGNCYLKQLLSKYNLKYDR